MAGETTLKSHSAVKKDLPLFNSLDLEPLSGFCLPMLKMWRDASKVYFPPACNKLLDLTLGGKIHIMLEMWVAKKGTNFFHRVGDFVVSRECT